MRVRIAARGSDSFFDNKGNKLTKEQQEHFKDVAPELKDENGNLKVFYHGTARADRVYVGVYSNNEIIIDDF